MVVKVPTYTDKYTVQGELVREVYYQFKKDGISIPFPTRTVYMEGDSGGKKELKLRKVRKA